MWKRASSKPPACFQCLPSIRPRLLEPCCATSALEIDGDTTALYMTHAMDGAEYCYTMIRARAAKSTKEEPAKIPRASEGGRCAAELTSRRLALRAWQVAWGERMRSWNPCASTLPQRQPLSYMSNVTQVCLWLPPRDTPGATAGGHCEQQSKEFYARR